MNILNEIKIFWIDNKFFEIFIIMGFPFYIYLVTTDSIVFALAAAGVSKWVYNYIKDKEGEKE